jgi:3-hydroxymyristoyl/3-hydroxydecanoyl-(acyl carrier protein) dehydratase
MKFRMVDRILAWEPQRSIRGVKALSFEEYCIPSPFGLPEELPQSLLLEGLFQLARWLVALSSDFKQSGLVTHVERCEFETSIGPGEHMVIDVTAREFAPSGILFDAVGRAGKRTLAVAEGCAMVLHPLALDHDPDDLRVLYSEIHRPLRTSA